MEARGYRCAMDRKDGRPCYLQAVTLIDGIAACKYHVGAAVRLVREAHAEEKARRTEVR
jgi:hypothetical protein